jgi:hypothetical protein
MNTMTKTKLLLTGLLAGAVAFGTACKTDKGTTTPPSTGTDTSVMSTDGGTGGAGQDIPVSPLPQEGTREMEPGVHEGNTHGEPGTGGTGLEPETEPIDRADDDSLGGETGDEPLNPGAPANQPPPTEDMMDDGERSTEPRD